MSGALGTLTSLLDGLFESSFRGVEFHVPDTAVPAGRRVAEWLFPGRDGAIHQDLGGIAGRVRVTGIIVGDDYVRRAKALKAAFDTPGPATLIDPWWGEMRVVLIEASEITFAEREVRVGRFTATFAPWIEQPKAPRDTLGEILAAYDELRGQARAWLRRVLAPVRMALGALAAVRGAVSSVSSLVAGAIGLATGAGGTMRALTREPLGLLDTLAASAAPLTADAVTDAIAAPGAALSTAATASDRPMVAPGGLAVLPDRLADPAAAAAVLLDAAARVPGLAAALPGAAVGTPAAGVLAAARLLLLADAALCVAALPFVSRQEAEGWRDRLDGALTAGLQAASAEAVADPAGAAPVRTALAALRRACLADLHERIGRLPTVATLTAPARPVSAWAIAYHLAGDDPAAVRAVMEDLVARNGWRHPSLVPPGSAVEYLAGEAA